jgi:hypothetical protein
LFINFESKTSAILALVFGNEQLKRGKNLKLLKRAKANNNKKF